MCWGVCWPRKCGNHNGYSPRQVTRSSPLQGEKVESLHVALTAEKPTRAAEATVTAEGIKDERSASLSPTAEACAPAAAMEMTTEVGVHDQKRSLGISAAHKVKRYALNQDARKTDEKTKLRQFLLSAPPPSKLAPPSSAVISAHGTLSTPVSEPVSWVATEIEQMKSGIHPCED